MPDPSRSTSGREGDGEVGGQVGGEVGRAPASTDPRNVFGGRRDALFRLYVLSVVAGGAVVLVLAGLTLDWAAVVHLGPAFSLVVLLLVFAELRPLFTSGSRDVNGLALSTAFVYALVLRFGLPVGVFVQALGTTIVDISKRKAPWRTCFNASQYALSWAAAAGAMSLFGRVGSVGSPMRLAAGELLGAAAGGLVYFLVNQLLVGLAISLMNGTSLRAEVWETLSYEALTTGTLLALSPLVALTMERGVAFVPLLVPPLFAVYKVASVALEREREAMSDALTGLPNRKLLADRTAQALQDSGGSVALLLLDLDRFKEVNDTLGHHVGDRLLQVVGERLSTALRAEDTVARLGGDEFAVLLADCGDAAAAERTARRLRESVSVPIVLEGLLVDVGASVGVALAPADGRDLDELLQHADVAMYLAKESGGGVESYDVERDENSTGRLAMLGELRRAIVADQLELHYQPKVDVSSGAVIGVEALVRWRHPVRGLLPPDDFVPLAERSGLMQPLTAWVLDAALAQLARWRAQGLQLRMAVNISVRDLSGGPLAEQVSQRLAAHRVPAGLLQLEVTEGSLFADPVRATATLNRLDELGVSLSLDDFGTGYSSLGHLRGLPVQEVKIDKSFVQRMEDDPRDLAIVRSVIDLAAGLGMQVVAEGVETEGAWLRLRELGCDSAQGWWLSKALPADRLTPWLLARAAAEPSRRPTLRPALPAARTATG